MKNILIAFTMLTTFQSCSFDTAENYFDRTTLNTNKLRQFGSSGLRTMIEQKDAGSLFVINGKELDKTNSVEDHIISYLIPDLKADIQKVKDLKPTDDTKALIEASLNVYTFAQQKYENDYIEIAKLIDNGSSKEVIANAILKFDEAHIPKLDKLLNNLMTIAIPYAKENGIQVQAY